MPKGRFDFDDYVSDQGNSGFGRGHPRGLDLKPDIPFSTVDVKGIDLTHIIHTPDVAAAKQRISGSGQ